MAKKKPKAAPAPKPEPLCVHVRWMIRRDMAEIQAIEEAAFPFPWSEEDFLRCLRQRNCIGMVAELKTDGNPVVGIPVRDGSGRRGTRLAGEPAGEVFGDGFMMAEIV